MDAVFAGSAGRWEVRASTFRQDGLPHQLLVLSDLSRVLRAEERSAWQRLVRVLGHEINNSLAPINSLAGSLRSLVQRPARPTDWEQDLVGGLQVIEGRSEALSRFMGASPASPGCRGLGWLRCRSRIGCGGWSRSSPGSTSESAPVRRWW